MTVPPDLAAIFAHTDPNRAGYAGRLIDYLCHPCHPCHPCISAHDFGIGDVADILVGGTDLPWAGHHAGAD